MTSPSLLTPEEAADLLHVSTKTLRQLRQQGLIRYVAVTERRILYRPEDCAAFIDARSRTEEPTFQRPPRPRRRTSRGSSGNVLSFTARRRDRLREGEAG